MSDSVRIDEEQPARVWRVFVGTESQFLRGPVGTGGPNVGPKGPSPRLPHEPWMPKQASAQRKRRPFGCAQDKQAAALQRRRRLAKAVGTRPEETTQVW